MKKYFIMAVAVLATLTACQPDEPQTTIVETREISFAPMATETRATAVDETKTETLQAGFAVWGYVISTGSTGIYDEIFSNTLVKYVNAANGATSQFGNTAEKPVTKVWQPEGGDVKYWAPNSTYWFSAMYPRNGANYNFTTNGTSHTQKITNFAISQDHSTKDIVVARPTTAVIGSTQTRPAVGLTFDHMLARVKFSFTNKFEDANVKIKVTNVVLNNVVDVANAEISSEGVATWTDAEPASTTTIKFQDDIDVFELAQNAVGTTQYRLFIPQNVTNEGYYTLTFDLEVLADGVTVLTKQYKVGGTNENAPVGLKAYNYVNGNSYSFNANISGDLLSEEIYPIQFDVVVTPWPTEDTVVDNDIFDPNN